MEDFARRAYDELSLCDGLSAAFDEQKTIAEKRKVQSERLQHAANAARLFHEANDPAQEAESYLLSSRLFLQRMVHEPNGNPRIACSSQVMKCCESAFESLTRSGRLDIVVRGLLKIVESLVDAIALLGEASNPDLDTALRKYSEALGVNMALFFEMEKAGYDCLTNSVMVGVRAEYAADSDKARVLQLKKELDQYATEAFNVTGNYELLEEVERVSAETRNLGEEQEVHPVQFCEGCGRQLPAETVYCPSCGRKRQVEEHYFCEGCGKQIAAGSAYCPDCGRKQPVP